MPACRVIENAFVTFSTVSESQKYRVKSLDMYFFLSVIRAVSSNNIFITVGEF